MGGNVESEQLELDVSGHSKSEAAKAGSDHLLVTPAWYGLKQQIYHLSQFGGSVQVVCGDVGSGKTALLDLLMEESESAPFVVLHCSKDSDLASLLHCLLSELGVRVESTAQAGELVAALRGYARTLEKDGERVVVAIDDAHFLDDGALAALISVLQGNLDTGLGLHFLMTGTPGLIERIDSLQLFDISVSDVQMPNFSPSELKTLLQGCVESNRLSSTLPVEEVQKIWVQSAGLPGVALDIADQMSADQAGEKSVWARAGWPYSHLAALFVLVGIFMWAFFTRDESPSPQLAENSNLDRMHQAEQGSEVKEEMGVPDRVTVGDNAAPPNALETTASAINVPPAAVEKAASALNPPVIEGVNLSKSEDTGPIADAPKSQLVESEVKHLAPNEQSAVVPVKDVIKPQAIKEAEVAPKLPPKLIPATPPRTEDGGGNLPLLKVQQQESLQSANHKPQGVVSRGEQRLLALPPNGYVLQLMATSALTSLEAFIARQANQSNLMVYQGQRGGKQLYILVEGFYNDTTAARAAVANLPVNQRKGGPWPKRISDIHRDIRQNN